MRNLLSLSVLVLAAAPVLAVGQPNDVPEPSTYALFAAAAVAAVVLRRRSK